MHIFRVLFSMIYHDARVTTFYNLTGYALDYKGSWMILFCKQIFHYQETFTPR